MTQVVASKLSPFVVTVFTDSIVNAVTPDHRLSVVRWKASKDKTTGKMVEARSAVCAMLPIVPITVTPTILQTAMTSAIEDMQDGVLRSWVEETISGNTSINLIGMTVPSELFTVEGIAAWNANKTISGRLSKETIGQWFDMSLETALGVKLAEINPSIEDDKLVRAIEQHKKLLMELASPKASLPEHVAAQLAKAVSLVEGNDKVKEVLSTKLATFMVPKEITLALGL